jgi:hypothetical protein
MSTPAQQAQHLRDRARSWDLLRRPLLRREVSGGSGTGAGSMHTMSFGYCVEYRHGSPVYRDLMQDLLALAP